MQYRTRQYLFYGAVLIFFVGSYVAFLYAQGYKYSFSENTFLRTGAIYLKANESAKVFVRDELVDSTSFLTNSLGIDGLLPGDYTVRLQKDGYSSWQKTVNVKEGLVTEFSRIMLLPQSEEEISELTAELDELFASGSGQVTYAPSPTPKPKKPLPSPSVTPEPEPFYISGGKLYRTVENEPVILAEKVLGFSISENENRLAWWTGNELWVLWLRDADYQPYHKKDDKELITRLASPIKAAVWFRDEDHVAVNAGGYKVIETDTRGGINIIKI